MTDIILPRLNQAGSNEWGDVEANDVAIREVVNGELDNNNLSGSAGITLANLAAEAKPVAQYEPKAIAAEQSRENTAYGFLSTEDKIEGVAVAENAIVRVWYSALWKESKTGVARAALFIGANQLSVPVASAAPQVQAARTGGGEPERLLPLITAPIGLVSTPPTVAANSSFVTTGMSLALANEAYFDPENKVSFPGGPVDIIRLAAGTYTIGVKFKASSGSVAAKERILQVATFG